MRNAINGFLISKIISVLIFIISLLVLYGWTKDITFLISLKSNWVSMKIITAICFLLSSIMLFYLNDSTKCKHKEVIISCCSQWILLLMLLVSFDCLSNFKFGFNSVFSKEININTIETFPAINTVIALSFISLVGLVYVFNSRKKYKRIQKLGITIFLIGIVGLLGYLINWPLLYSKYGLFSNEMAFHTCLLFILYGIGLKYASHYKV